MSDWQPFGSAPKDGTVIDLWVITRPELEGTRYRGGLGRQVLRRRTGKRVCGIFWEAANLSAATYLAMGEPVYEGRWREVSEPHVWGFKIPGIATHWMLVPAPPKTP